MEIPALKQPWKFPGSRGRDRPAKPAFQILGLEVRNGSRGQGWAPAGGGGGVWGQDQEQGEGVKGKKGLGVERGRESGSRFCSSESSIPLGPPPH